MLWWIPLATSVASSFLGGLLSRHNADKAAKRVISSAPDYKSTIGAQQSPWGGIAMTPTQQTWYGLAGAAAGDIANWAFNNGGAMGLIGKELFGEDYKPTSLFNWSGDSGGLLSGLLNMFTPENIYRNVPNSGYNFIDNVGGNVPNIDFSKFTPANIIDHSRYYNNPYAEPNPYNNAFGGGGGIGRFGVPI